MPQARDEVIGNGSATQRCATTRSGCTGSAAASPRLSTPPRRLRHGPSRCARSDHDPRRNDHTICTAERVSGLEGSTAPARRLAITFRWCRWRRRCRRQWSRSRRSRRSRRWHRNAGSLFLVLKKSGFETLIASPPDYENLVAEIYFDGKFVALISQEKGLGCFHLEFPAVQPVEALVTRDVELRGFQDAG